ncbi:hypothetical protein CORC01_00472 [Colletotrichum orchidophilum]|uniref:Suppressor of anucleate metulae protein B n=1 Tax=Colletotrichum orchidophilum TaxID=1209926 RepID=A0A1G4BRX7_9PEZI|nr:uncharacterized protein CORC01_00472 [Colletotrichum orchidophilum]OHF04133.1 hypothetical protein CORC01_00472 [Colletotrichum orchidophilum]
MSSSNAQSMWEPLVTFTVQLAPVEQYSMELKGGESGRGWALHNPETYASCSNKEERHETEQCLACSNPSTRKYRCPCKAARYCSAECQAADDLHPRLCLGRQAAKAVPSHGLALEQRPSNNHYVAAILPTDDLVPRFIWLGIHMNPKTGQMTFATDRMDFAKSDGKSDDKSSNPSIIHIGLNALDTPMKKELGHGVDLLKFGPHNDTTTRNLNKCLLSFGKPGFVACHFGLNIVWAYDIDANGAFKSPRDVSVRDIRHAIDCHVLNASNPAISQPNRFILAGGMIRALKVNDLSDKWMEALGVSQQVEKVMIPKEHESFEAYPVSRLFHLGLRWYIRTAIPIGTQPTGEIHEDHEELLDVFRETVSKLKHPSSFHLLQVCGNQIESAHLNALLEYLRLAKASNTPASENGFRKYWEYFKRKETDKGHPLDGIPSPYDLENGRAHDANSAVLVNMLQAFKSYEKFLENVTDADDHVEGGLNKPKAELTGLPAQQIIEKLSGIPTDQT